LAAIIAVFLVENGASRQFEDPGVGADNRALEGSGSPQSQAGPRRQKAVIRRPVIRWARSSLRRLLCH